MTARVRTAPVLDMRLAIVLALVFGVGSCMGSRTNETEIDYIEVPRTKIVEVPAEAPVSVAVMPEACASALEYGRSIAVAAELNYKLSDVQLDIISLTRSLLAQGKNTAPAEERQRDLQGDTVGNLSDLEESFYFFEKYRIECEDELK